MQRRMARTQTWKWTQTWTWTSTWTEIEWETETLCLFGDVYVPMCLCVCLVLALAIAPPSLPVALSD